MVTHLFLTGEKGVGKSTLVKKLIAASPTPVGGFFTVKTDTVFAGRGSVHLLQAGRAELPSPENLLFFCGSTGADVARRFHLLGCAALDAKNDIGLLVMDELGPHEENASEFCQAVRSALDGDIPILGVLQEADSPWLKQIAAHPCVRLVRVTQTNRDFLCRD